MFFSSYLGHAKMMSHPLPVRKPWAYRGPKNQRSLADIKSYSYFRFWPGRCISTASQPSVAHCLVDQLCSLFCGIGYAHPS